MRIEEMSPDEAGELLPKMLLDAWAAAIGQPAHVTSTFEEITGTPPRKFRNWAIDHAAEFQARG